MRYDPLVNFTAGEISPKLRGRVDIDAYRHAASEMTNFQPLQYGGVRRRFGTELMLLSQALTTRSRLIPFVLGVGNAYVIELSNLALRVHAMGNYVAPSYSVVTHFTATTPYTTAQLRDVRFAQSGNFLVLVHPDHEPYALSRRSSDTDWWFRRVTFMERPMSAARPVYLRASGDLSIAAGTGSKTATGSADTFHAGDVGRLITRGNGLGRITAVASATSATVDVLIDFDGTTGAWFLHGQPATSLTFSATALSEGESVSITSSNAGFRNGDATWGWIFALDGIFAITGVTPDGTTVTARVVRSPTPGGSGTTAAYRLLRSTLGWPLGQSTEWVNGYPATVAFHDQRLVFGGLKGAGQTFIGSVAGDVLDFTLSGEPGDAYHWSVESATPIQHMVVDNDLLLLTQDAEYAASGQDLSTITGSDVRIRKQSEDGASGVQPVKVGREHVFVTREGKTVRALAFEIAINGYDTKDLTLLAEHITGPGIVEMAFARRPVPTLYCVRSDGKMACLTLDAKQRVSAWWLWETEGEIESVVSVPLAGYDEVWMSVKRPHYANAERRHLERVQQTHATFGVTTGYLLDSARRFDRVPSGATSVLVNAGANYGLKTVQVVADGFYGGQYATNNSGEFLVPFDYTFLVVGLPYTSTLTPMPPEIPTATGTGQGRAAQASEVTVKLHDTIGGKANGQALKKLVDGMPRARRLASEVPWPRNIHDEIINADAKVAAQGWKQGEPLVTITQDEPLPMHVLAVIQKVQVNP